MASSTAAPTNNPSNTLINETALHEYMRLYVDYQENGIDLHELSHIRQLDIHSQKCYDRVHELVKDLRDQAHTSPSELQNMLINTLIQAKAIGDKKMQLSQQMLDAAERQSKKLKIAHQIYVESTNQQSSSAENHSNEADSDDDSDGEMNNHRSLSAKASTTSLWKRKTTTSNASTLNIKRKCVTNSDYSSSDQRDRKKPAQRNATVTTQNSLTGNGKKLKLNNESSSTPSDEPTYCLCSQLSYGSMILCDSKACDIKWFHFNCVNLTSKPKGKWFCPNCRDNRS